ncbi:Ig-like domain-containing protein [Lentilactobacillus buchneri]|nr:Ig-like domain-containing protein [Lentilactobacillus sp. Egmn17]
MKAESSTQVIDRMNTELTYIAQKAEKTGGNVLVVSSGMSIPEWLSTQKNYTVPGFVNWGNEATMKVTYKNGQFYFPSNVTDKTILYTINKGAALQQLPKNTLKVNKFYLNKNKVSGSTSTGASLVLQNTKGSTLKKTNANSNGNFVFKLSKATLNKLKKGMNLKLTSTPKNASKSLNMNSDQISQTVFGNKTATIKVLK